MPNAKKIRGAIKEFERKREPNGNPEFAEATVCQKANSHLK